MPDRDKLRPDVNEASFRTVQAATGQGGKPKPPGQGEPNPIAVERGRQGGRKGGNARNTRLTAAQRKTIARNAANTRWKNSKPR